MNVLESFFSFLLFLAGGVFLFVIISFLITVVGGYVLFRKIRKNAEQVFKDYSSGYTQNNPLNEKVIDVSARDE